MAEITVISLILIPIIDIFSIPFHPAIIFILYLSLNRLNSISNITVILSLIATPILAEWQSFALFSNSTINLRSVYSGLPLALSVLSFYLFHREGLPKQRIFRIFLLAGALLSVITVLNLTIQSAQFYHAIGWIPEHRLPIYDKYSIVIAPLGNPNNTAVIVALVTISLLFLQPELLFRRVTRFFLYFILLLLFIALFYTYARTVVAAMFVCLVVFYMIRTTKNPRKHFPLALVAGAGLIGGTAMTFFGTGLNYYLTIFRFWEADSLIVRIDHFMGVIHAMNLEFTSYLIGHGYYESALMSLKHDTIIDSNFLYILIQFGIIGGVLFVCGIRHKNWFTYRGVLLAIFLTITSSTLPYLSDFRLGILLSALVAFNLSAYNNSEDTQSPEPE